MKLFAVLLALTFPFITFAQHNEKSPVVVWNVNGTGFVTTNGFAPIPAFSLEKPAAMIFLSVQRGRFSYQPDVALGIDGDLWMNNHWFRYRLAGNNRFTFEAGMNVSLFFLHETESSGKEHIRANRNLTAEAAVAIQTNGKSTIRFQYRYNYAVDSGTISGHMIDLSGHIQEIARIGLLFLELRPQLFYFDHTGNMDGFFASSFFNFSYKDFPVSLFSQKVYRIWSNFTPHSVFRWNAGVKYVF